MKTIVLISQIQRRYVLNKNSAGIQAVEKMQVDLLSKHYKIHFLITSDSDDIYKDHPNVTVHKLGGDSIEVLEEAGISKKEKSNISRKRSAIFKKLITEINPDIIINHCLTNSRQTLCVQLANTCTVLTFLHQAPDSAMDISLFGKLRNYSELTKHGGYVVCVSKYQRDLWRSKMKARIGHKGFDALTDESLIDQIFDKVCYSAIASEKAPVNKAEDYFIMVARPDPEKNIGLVLKAFYKLGIKDKIKIFMGFGKSLESYDYYMKRIKPYVELLGDQVELHCNKTRDELLDSISRAKALIVAMTIEAAPVAPVEALSSGVGSIVFCKQDSTGNLHHACYDVIDIKNQTTMIGIPVVPEKRLFDEFKTAIEQANNIFCDPENRRLSRIGILNKHSENARLEELIALIESPKKYKSNLITF